MPTIHRPTFIPALSLIMASGITCLSCATTPPTLSSSEAAELIARDVHLGMTRSEVRRILGEPKRRESTSLPPGDVAWKTQAGDDNPGECWLWGENAMNPEAAVCFSGIDQTVSQKRP